MNGYRTVLSVAWMLYFCVSAFANEFSLFQDGGFEEGGTGWNLPKPFWNVKKGAGFEGTSGLSFEVKEGQKIAWPVSGFFPVEGGLAYRLEAWQNTQAFKVTGGKGTLKLYFMVFDKAGNALGSFGGAARAPDNSVRKDGWYRVECFTRVLPAEAVKARLHIWSYDGFGNAQIDNIIVRPEAVNPVDQLCCSAYRSEAWEGKVSFSAAYCVNPLKHPDSELECVLDYAGAKGKAQALGTLSDSVATVTLPIESIAFGRNEVRLTVRRKDGMKVLGTSSCQFTREFSGMPRKVTFDSLHRTIVDGKPFFPLGMYWGEITADDIATYTNGPFNCLMPYKRPDEKKLDICHAAGVKVIYPISGFFIDIDEAKTKQQAEAINSKYIRDYIRRYRSHPAVMAWYLADEVPAKYEPILAAKRAAVHEIDPDHPTWIVLDKPMDVRPLINGYDVIGMDPYPVGNNGGRDRTEIGIAAGWARQAKIDTYGFKPMWHVPQAFDWGYYRNSETNRVDVRMPNYAEIRSMTWQAIAAGANGLVYYSFFDLLKRDKWPKSRTAGAWENVCKVAQEVKSFEPILLSGEEPPVVTGTTKDICARAWRYDGAIYLIFANTTRKHVKGNVYVKADFAKITMLNGSKGCTLTDSHTVSVALDGLGVAFVRLDLKK